MKPKPTIAWGLKHIRSRTIIPSEYDKLHSRLEKAKKALKEIMETNSDGFRYNIARKCLEEIKDEAKV